MNDVRQDISVPASRYTLKETTGLNVHTVANALSLRKAGASATTCGLSNSTPRGPAWRVRMATSMLPVAPPTSTIVLKIEKS